MKKLIANTLLLVLASTMYLNVNAQKTTADTVSLKAKTKIDITELLKKPIYKPGNNKVTKLSNGYTINVKLADKKVPEYFVTDTKGVKVPTSYFKASITCWNCFKDTENNDNCYIIPCPVVKSSFAGARATGIAVLK